ncbi:helix-turn-helix domain-containing protein [Bisbaumannia pacifica]|uniref:Helix-turn-helix domain-containing protein n=1 Tax=Bisbaumannia pacifica TaxID=77098 RepID=A0A510X6L2_9GAMM|nr:helix-turn-helix domain-containing protein [Halomonas pacifica]MBH8578687.1 helix-turn-helix domain-containing protein [Halomonas pacifica]GEK46075.1 transcriptional regulator [Halomonas pacifica]
MKPRVTDDREAALVTLLGQFYAGELTEGKLLRALRRDVLGLSQDRYAALVGISRRTLSDLEGDKGNATLELINRAFKPLGLEMGLLPRQRRLLAQVLDLASDARP